MGKKKKKKDNNIEQIYTSQTIDKPKSLPFFSIIIIALASGFCGGVIGEFISENYFEYDSVLQEEITIDNTSKADIPLNEGGNKPIAIEQTSADTIPQAEITDNIAKVKASVVNIYIKRDNLEGDILEQTYLLNDSVGKGFILTSDGWVVTNAGNLQMPFTSAKKTSEEKQEFIVITKDKKIYDITEYTIDPFTNIAFFQINAQNLPVAQLGNTNNINISEPVILFNFDNMVVTFLKNLNYSKIQTKKDLIQSSSKYYQYILLNDNISKNFVGSPVINTAGEIIGIIDNVDESGNAVAMPINYILPVLKNIFKNNEPKRPYLGVDYIDLSTVVTDDYSNMLKKGALIYKNNDLKILGVQPESPAAKAKLMPSDIILKVENDEINERHTLTQLIQEYPIGSTVKLLILRSNLEQEIEVTLEELK